MFPFTPIEAPAAGHNKSELQFTMSYVNGLEWTDGRTEEENIGKTFILQLDNSVLNSFPDLFLLISIISIVDANAELGESCT